MSPITRAEPGTEPAPRELAALRAYIATGSIKGTAHELGLSEATVKVYLSNVRSRMGAKTTAEAVLRLAHRLAA